MLKTTYKKHKIKHYKNSAEFIPGVQQERVLLPHGSSRQGFPSSPPSLSTRRRRSRAPPQAEAPRCSLKRISDRPIVSTQRTRGSKVYRRKKNNLNGQRNNLPILRTSTPQLVKSLGGARGCREGAAPY